MLITRFIGLYVHGRPGRKMYFSLWSDRVREGQGNLQWYVGIWHFQSVG